MMESKHRIYASPRPSWAAAPPKAFMAKDGAVLIEFVFVLPLLMLFLFAAIEFGVGFFDKAMITNAAREGARAGIVFDAANGGSGGVSDARIEQTATDYCQTHLITFGAANAPTVTVTRGGSGTDPGDPLTVTVTYNYRFFVIPNLIPGFNKSLLMQAVSVMRLE